MNFSKSTLRKTLVAVATAGGLAAWAVPGLTQNGPPASPGVGHGMMGGRAAPPAEAPGPQGGYGPGCGYGYGMGPGMMYGYGPGMMYGYGHGYRMRPGMMYGYGPGYRMGPGMMYGYGHGMGPGMMYGYGPGMMYGYGHGYRMGPGMMYGYGMGPGMMYGYGHGVGPGMMYGYGPGYALPDLTDEQQAKLEKIYTDARQKQWDLASKSIPAAVKLRELIAAEKPDHGAVASAYKALSDLRLRRLELRLDTRARVDAVLTKEQREQLQGWRGGWMGPWQ